MQPGCSETVDGEPIPPREVTLRRVDSSPARVAVAVDGDAQSVWAAAGFFVQHRTHPLFGRVVVKRPERPRCARRRVVFSGEVARQPTVYEPLMFRRGFTEVRVGARTVFRGRRLHGLPYADAGDALRVVGRRCWRSDHRVRVIRPLSIRIVARSDERKAET